MADPRGRDQRGRDQRGRGVALAPVRPAAAGMPGVADAGPFSRVAGVFRLTEKVI